MKKMIVLLCMLGMVLVSCSNEEGSDEPELNQETTNVEKAASDESEETNESSLMEYIEYDIVAEHIDLDTYSPRIETDNHGSRVILYIDDQGSEQYKSVYIKEISRLEIIEFNENGMIFEGTVN
ncbi:hypothetical protein RYX56_17155 [Alkalihalophilus lindianensis]|uniref:Uncharacterized protein n=1 Tax=Alkalihalophilus lindianensis TaxID=1630542 RepID=A0ABU3XFD9_9BACI|nr:hypothetical protein [Alkalihalophilus lindianensis]MDV2686099.1 hypothetical protein [Alkalihalophilus lindianensis]